MFTRRVLSSVINRARNSSRKFSDRIPPSQRKPVKAHEDAHHHDHHHGHSGSHPTDAYAPEFHATYPTERYVFGEPAGNYLTTSFTLITVATYAAIAGILWYYPESPSPSEGWVPLEVDAREKVIAAGGVIEPGRMYHDPSKTKFLEPEEAHLPPRLAE